MIIDHPSNRIWTIRLVPWFTLLIFSILCIVDIALIIFNEEARCGASVLLIMFIVGIFAFETVTCTLDQDRRVVTLKRTQIFKNSLHEFSFDDIHTVSVQAETDPDSVTYHIVFALKSGDVIPLTKYTTSDKFAKEKMVRQIIEYINTSCLSPINASMDGTIRVERNGETNGIPWTIAYVSANDGLPHTRWHSPQSGLASGFIILMPASGMKTGNMPGGLFGSAVRMIYEQYLKMLDVNLIELPDFDKAVIIKSDEFGLEKQFTVLTNDINVAKAWLSNERVQRLHSWIKQNPLGGGKSAIEPHLVVTQNGLRMTFRGRFNNPEQINAIAFLGSLLVM